MEQSKAWSHPWRKADRKADAEPRAEAVEAQVTGAAWPESLAALGVGADSIAPRRAVLLDSDT